MKLRFNMILSMILIAAVLAGCNRNAPAEETTPTQTTVTTESTEAPETEATEAATEATDPVIGPEDEIPGIPLRSMLQNGNPKNLEDWVIENYRETFTWKDASGNTHTVSVTLPALAPVADFALHYNERVHNLGNAILAAISSQREEGLPASEASIRFEAQLRDDVLSILMIREMADGSVLYTADSFDVEDREELSAADLCDELLELDYPQFLAATNPILTAEFDRLFGSKADPALRASIATDLVKLANRELFLGDQGQLMLLYTLPGNTPGSTVQGYLPLTADSIDRKNLPTEQEAYDAFFAMMEKADGAYADAAARMLKDAFLADSEYFAEFASVQKYLTPAQIGKLIVSVLIYDDAVEFQWDCQELLQEEDLSSAARSVVNDIFKQYGH